MCVVDLVFSDKYRNKEVVHSRVFGIGILADMVMVFATGILLFVLLCVGLASGISAPTSSARVSTTRTYY